MAQKVTVVLEDDLDGGPADETVVFGIDGNTYEIDLSTANSGRLRDALAEFIGHARRAGRPAARSGPAAPSRSSRSGGGAATRADREQTQAIREWARANGHDVKPRGRVPATIVEAYNAAH